MPRLTNPDYLERHCFCASMWHDFRRLFMVLSPKQQLDVHLYYQTRSYASASKLLQRRVELTKRDPSLPQRASKALFVLYQTFHFAFERSGGKEAAFHRALNAVVERHLASSGVALRQPGETLRVAVLMRPEPDLRAYARGIVEMVLDEVTGDTSQDGREADA